MEIENQKSDILIKKGTTNWLFVVAVALIAAAVGGALMVYVNDTIRQTDSMAQDVVLEKPQIKANDSIGQGSTDIQEFGDSAIKPKQLSRDFDSRAVFVLFNENSDALAKMVEELHKCNNGTADSIDCQVAVLKNAGASDDAIEFYRQSEEGVMTKYESYGSFALVNISYPFAANDNDKYMVFSGKNLWNLEDTDIAKVTGNESVAKEFPSPDAIWFEADAGDFIGQNKNGELVFAAGINAGCHVCATGYAAIINYKVDPAKDAVYADLKGFCTLDILINDKPPAAKYPACSAAIGF